MRFLYVFWSGMVILLGLCPASAFGQEPASSDTLRILDLPALLAELAENNPALEAARLDAEALGTRRRQVSGLPDPTFMVSYQPWPVGTARGTQRTQWRVEQQLPYPGKRALRGEIADLSAEVAAFEAHTVVQDLQLAVKQAYFDLYRIQEIDRLIASFQGQLRDFEEAAATRYEVGAGTQQAILKAQLERNRLDLRREQLAEQRQSAQQQLARLLDRPDAASFSGTVRVEPPAAGLDTTRLLPLALAQRPEAQALRYADQRAGLQIDLARRAFRPDFAFSLTYFDIAEADVPASADGRDALALGVGVKVPLWRAKLKAGLEEAQVKKRQTSLRVEALETAFRTQIEDLLSRHERQQRRLDLFDRALIPQAETTLEATLSAYTTGRTDFLDLLDAERTLFNLRLDQTETYTRYLKTTAALERALGVLWLDEIEP